MCVCSKVIDVTVCLQSGQCEMRVDLTYHGEPKDSSLTKSADGKYFAHYSKFYLGDEASGFTLHLDGKGYSGTAGDNMSWNNGRKFSTRDNDQDPVSWLHCARSRHGAWWYGRLCGFSNLNGKWGGSSGDEVYWLSLTRYRKSVTFSEMKLRLL